MAKMKVPKGCTSVSFDGVEYEAKKGVVDVPNAAIAELLPHGCTPVKEAEPADEPPPVDQLPVDPADGDKASASK